VKVLFATPEFAPWVKTGGLGDMAASLAPALRSLGIDLRVLLPCYPALQKAFPDAPLVAQLAGLGGELPDAALRAAVSADGVPLLLLDHPDFYRRPGGPYLAPNGRDWIDNHLRFGLLSRVAAWLGSPACTLDWRCDIVHSNDWQTALAPAYLHYLAPEGARSVLTLHNLAFQGLFEQATLPQLGLPDAAWQIDGVEFYDRLSFLKGGLQFADRITTVSPTYAQEIQTKAHGMGLDGLLRKRHDVLSGILNGIDTAAWNPAEDRFLVERYDLRRLESKAANKAALQKEMGLDIRADLPLFGVVSRLTEQKGLDLLAQLADRLVDLPAQLVALGSGDADMELDFAEIARCHPGHIACVIGFDEALAHRIEAGADIFVMPSRFEPCGLNQMYSLRYGTPPVVRATGGLADTVIDCNQTTLGEDRANGFVFNRATTEDLGDALRRAAETWRKPELWQRLQRQGMTAEFGWQESANRYAAIYRALVARRD